MPTYEYECEKCGHAFEAFQSMTETPIRVCPKCKARKVRRLIGTGAAVIFKGSGFYQTDYRSPDYKTQQKKDKEGASSSGAKDEKSEAKSSGTTSEKSQ